MLLGLFIRDKLARRHKKEDSDAEALCACQEQVEKATSERDAYKDKWMEARMECIVLTSDLKDARSRLDSIERRKSGL